MRTRVFGNLSQLGRMAARGMRRLDRSRRGRFWAGVLVGAAVTVPPAYAAMTVTDPTVNASTLKIHAETVKQLQQLEEQFAKLQEMYQTLGRAGSIGQGFNAGALREAQRLTGINLDIESWRLPDDFNPNVFNSVSRGTDALTDLLAVHPSDGSDVRSSAAVDEVQARRNTVHENAGYHALAMALSERQALGEAAGRVSALAAEAERTIDLHSDLVAANKLKVAELEQLVAIRGLLAALVEVAGSEAVRVAPVRFTARGTQAEAIFPRRPGGGHQLGE